MKSSNIVDIEKRFLRCPFCNIAFKIRQDNANGVEHAVEAVMSHVEKVHAPHSKDPHWGTCGVPFLSMRMADNGGN